jgi:N-acetylmuramoyl-L-alanine amidase
MESHITQETVQEPRHGAAPQRPIRVNFFRQVQVVFAVGAVLATLFTAWTPLGLIPLGWPERISAMLSGNPQGGAGSFPTPTPRPRPRVGIVSGHWGNDAGTVCADGFTEEQLNLEIATLVKEKLAAQGFEVDLLREFDEKLIQYNALALVSIHADSCDFVNNQATGYKVAAALASARPEKASRLVACMRSRYEAATGLPFHAGSITIDMTSYHAFDEIHNETTAAIIETGFMNLDRQILTQNQEAIAQGITNGVLCFIFNEDASLPSPTQQ